MTEPSIQLQPCPRCWSTALQLARVGYAQFQVICQGCWLRGPNKRDKATASSKWNVLRLVPLNPESFKTVPRKALRIEVFLEHTDADLAEAEVEMALAQLRTYVRARYQVASFHDTIDYYTYYDDHTRGATTEIYLYLIENASGEGWHACSL